MRKLKDLEYLEATIKIRRVKERYKDGSSCLLKPKLICINTEHPTYNHSTAFKDNKKGRKELLNFIKEDLYL